MRKIVTLKDVAAHAGVSVATVSHVLNNSKRVSPEVHRRTQQAVAATGYRPNIAARTLRTGRTGLIGLIVPDVGNPFFPPLIKAVEAQAKQQQYATLLFDSGYGERATSYALEFIRARRVDGLVWVVSSAERLPDAPLSIPSVIVDYAPASWFAVHTDDYAGGMLQAQHAAALGHRRVVALWGDSSIPAIRERRRGFMDGAAGQLEILDELPCPFDYTLPPDTQARLLSWRAQFSFVVCGNDTIAVATLRALKNAGLRVPDDVSVMGFDDSAVCQIVDPPLSSVSQSPAQLGQLAVDALLTQLRAEGTRPYQVVTPVALVVRASTQECHDA